MGDTGEQLQVGFDPGEQKYVTPDSWVLTTVLSLLCHFLASHSSCCFYWNISSLKLSVIKEDIYILLLQNSQKRKHKGEHPFFRILKCCADEFWIGCKWKWKILGNDTFWLLLATNSSIFLAVTKKIRLLLLLTVLSAIPGDCWGTYRAQLHLLPDFDASSTQEQISSLVQHFRANQNLFWTGAPSKAQNGLSEGGLHCKLLDLGKAT